MTVEDEVIECIKHLRRGEDTVVNTTRFYELIWCNKEIILENMSLRWLVSICDTIADFDYNHGVRACALSITTFVNMIRLAETHRRLVNDDPNPEAFKKIGDDTVELYGGLTTFAVHRQDTFLNLTKRTLRILERVPFLKDLYIEILRRLDNADSIVFLYRTWSDKPERYFPENALDLEDNYGVK